MIKPSDYRLYSSLLMSDVDNKRARIDLGALRQNYRILSQSVRARAPEARVIAVVKADAYGHGAPECVRTLLETGCDMFAVSCIEEAIAVRAVCREQKQHADILILGYTKPALAKHLAAKNFIQSLISPDYAEALASAAREAKVLVRTHIAVDTGMNRLGYCAHNTHEIDETVQKLLPLMQCPYLSVEGMFTHFATADENTDEARALMQVQADRYRSVKDALAEAGFSVPFHHVCNSAATVSDQQLLFNGVRIGILLYGGAASLCPDLPLRPVMRLQADISHIHPLLKGEHVSYGGTYVADRARTIAVLPIGYADGFLRNYSGATVTLQTKTNTYNVPVIGRVCMDQCMIDVTDTDAAIGDTVTLFGDDPDRLCALAERAGTIDYECLCLVSSRVKRTYENT